MDLFNIKKVKKLQKQIELLEQKIKQDDVYNNLLTAAKDIRCSSILLKENKKLIDWIEKILSEVSIYEVNNRERIVIPIYKMSHNFENRNNLTMIERKTIVIPEIVIEKQTEKPIEVK